MGSKVVVTYKRKRLFSRSDHSPINLHSDKPSEISDSKGSANFSSHEVSIDENTMQNKDIKFVKEAHRSKNFCSACPEQQNSSVPNVTQNLTLEQKACSQESNLTQITSDPNVTLEGSQGDRSQYDSTGQSNAEGKSAATKSKLLFVKWGSEYENKGKDMWSNEDKCKQTSSISPTPGASCGLELDLICLETSDGSKCSHQTKNTSVPGLSYLEERGKLTEDQCSSLCNNTLVTKRKLTSSLITFCRRSKRKQNAANNNIDFECTDKCASATPLAASSSVDLKNEKKPPEDISNLCSFSDPGAAMVMHVDNLVHFPNETAKNAPTAVGQVFENSHEEISSLEEKVCMNVQDKHRINVAPQDFFHEDANTKIPSNISVKRGFVSSLDLSISPPAPRDIDCNIPLDCDFGNNHLAGPFDVHDSLGSFVEINKNIFPSQVPCAGNGSHVRAVSDKGKFIVEPQPVKNNCMQLFPENRFSDTDQLAIDPENMARIMPSSVNTSRIHNLEQTVNGRAYYSSLYGFPCVQSKEPFQGLFTSTSNRADSLSRHLMMLDSILTRARGKFEFPTTWSEEELDCLWVGVRRHGMNRWDAIIRDPRLHFSPWKTERDLADRWQDEQYRLFHGRPVSQAKYTSQHDVFPNHLSLGVQQNPLHECGGQNRPPIVHYMDLARNRQFQKPVNHFSGCSRGLINPSEGSGFVKGNLPHWLKEAAEIPPKPPGPTLNVVSPACIPNFDYAGNSQQQWVNTKCTPLQRRTEPCAKASSVTKSGKRELHERQANSKKDDMININYDASSEESISDDRSTLAS